MKAVRNSFISIALCIAAVTAHATGGTQTTQTIDALQAGQAIAGGGVGPFLILFSANSVGSASCATTKNYFAVDPTTAQGRAVIGLAMLAYTTGVTVNAAGAGTCNIDSGIEDLAYIYTTP